MIILKTNHGDITLTLDFTNTPNTAKNFVDYAKSGFFNGTIFHRVIPDFMVQGGGFEPGMVQKSTNPAIENEANKGGANVRGSLAMARTMEPHSASSQFFINVKDNGFLNHKSPDPQGWGYCVFGQVTEGMDIVDAIVNVPTTSRQGHENVPIDDVVIESVVVEETV